MDLQREKKISELFQAMLDCPLADRPTLLAQICGGDRELQREVESLLSADEQAGSFLEQAPLEAAAAVFQEPAEVKPGQQVGPYRIQGELGHGGMGVVYLTRDPRLNRPVALKLLPAGAMQDPGRVQRFIQEAKAASALNHPNIITIYEIGQANGRHYIAIEFVDGQTLRRQMAGQRLKLEEALEVAIQVASALSAAHEAGIIHRDIKPENVMRRRDGIVKVLDFGLAKLTETPVNNEAPTVSAVRTESGAVIGTPRYMSPEQARGLKVDSRTDIFSLGIVLYEMVAGRPPFDGASIGDLMVAILTGEPPPLSGVEPATPAELERIVRKALQKDCEERYQDVKEMLADLKRLQRRLELAAEQGRTTEPALSRTLSIGMSRGGGTGGEGQATTRDGGVTARQTASITASLLGTIKRHTLHVALTLLLLLAGVAATVYFTSLRGGEPTIDSIAVLPFVNEGANPDTEYLSDGITDSLINSLSQLSHLSVKARSSVFRYKGKEVEPQQVAAALSVRALLYGRVVQRGDDLILYLSLVDGRTGNQLWGEQYNRKLADLVTLQNGIARDVSSKLRARLSGADEQRLAKNPTENAAAYQLYLKGLYEWNKHTQEDVQKSIEYYKQALEKDPNYALAYFGLSASYSVLGNEYYWPPRDANPLAKEYAAKALALDDTLAEAHAAMGAIKLFYDWDFAGAEKELKRAQILDPNYWAAHLLYGDYLEILGRFDEAKAERKRALELDQLSPILNVRAGAQFYFAGQYDEAIAQLEKTIYLEPHYYFSYQYLGQAYEQKKKYEQAIETLQKGMRQAERHPQLLAALGHTYALSGEPEKAQQVLDELREMSRQRYISPYLFTVVYAGLGDKEQTFVWLERAYQDRSFLLIWLKVEPLFDPLRSEPRFQDLLRRIGLAQ